MISNRNAASGRAATAATREEERRLADQAFSQGLAQQNQANTPDVLPGSPGSMLSVAPQGLGETAAPAAQTGRTAPTAPVAPPPGNTPVINRDKVLRDGKRTENDDKDSAVDRALKAFEDGEPMTQEIRDIIQGAYDGTNQDVPFTPTNSSPNEGLVNRGQRQDQILANVGQQPLPGSGANGTGFAPNNGIAGAFQDTVGPVTPSGRPVGNMETIAEPAVQSNIDRVIEESTDPTTGEPVSPEASDQMGRSIYELMRETGVELTPEEVYGHIAARQNYLNAGNTRAQADYNSEVENNVYAELQKRGVNGIEELTQGVRNNPDLSPRDREAYLSALGRFTSEEGNNAGYFTSTGGENLGTDTDVGTFEESLAQVRDRTDLASFLDLDAQGLEDTEEGSTSSGLTRTVEALVSSAGEDLDYENVLSTVQKFQSESGLPYSVIQAQLENSLTGNWLNTKAVLNEDILRRNLRPYLNDETGKADPAAIERVQSAARAQRGIRTDMDLLNTEVTSLNNEYRVLLDRPDGPEVRSQIADLRTRHTEIMAEAAQLNGNAGNLLTPTTVGNGTDDDTIITPDPEQVIGGADTRFQVPNDATTPEGNAYEDNASEFGRFVNANRRNGEVGGAIVEITNRLRSEGGGGDFGIRSAFGEMTDAFRPRDVSDQNSANRDSATAAREWYQSDAGQELLFNNPMLLTEAQKDPVAFYRKHASNQ
jgi:hypothetical protein